MKKHFEVAVSYCALLALVLPMLLLAWLICRNFGRQVLFKQTRPDLNCRPFTMVKYQALAARMGQRGRQMDEDK